MGARCRRRHRQSAMMPGETPPPAAVAGFTAEVASACANCGVLQQKLNEYVAALIALKQKIIDTDHLLTDYEQKCTELKSAERENNAFRQQVEQMLQKLSPLEECKEELGSVKAELEEKKSSLKIYQDTHLEYKRVKEEMSKSDAMKKKLEAKVKKLEKATEKHNQDFKQLKAEKKVLEKELKKAQEKIEGFPNEKQKKVVKHAQTQSEREWPVTNLDKEKIKLLLEELWLCIDSSTGNSNFNKNDCFLANFHNSKHHGKTEAVQNLPKFKRARGQKPSHCSSPETCTTQPSLTSLQIKLDSRPARHGGPMENEFMETSEAYISNGATYKGRSPELIIWTDPAAGTLDPVSKEPEGPGENLREILKWVKPLPPLLSPIQFSPATTPDILLGELSDSSSEEIDQDAQMLESILDNCDESVSEADAVTRKNPAELQSEYSSSDVTNKSRDSCELPGRPTALKPNKSVSCLDPLVATSGFLNEIGAKSKNGKKPVEENSEFMERDTEIAVHSTENIAKNTADVTKTENKSLVEGLLPVNSLQGQEKTGEPKHVLEVATSSFEGASNESCDFTKEDEKEELMGPVEASVSSLTEDDQHSVCKGSSPQRTEGPENALVDKDGSINVIEVAMMEEGSEDIQAEYDLGEIRPRTEGAVPVQNRIEEFCAQCDGEPDCVERKTDFDNLKFHSETDHHTDRFQQQHNEVALMEAIGKDVQASNTSIKLYLVEGNNCNEDGCHKDSECDVNEEAELVNVDVLQSKCNIALAAEGWEKSLRCTSEVFLTGHECTVAPSASKNKEGDKPKTENEFIVQKDKMAENIVEETLSVVVTEDCPQIEDHIEKKDLSRWLQEEPGNRDAPVSSVQVSLVKNCLPQSEGPVQTNQTAPEVITGNASELEQFEDPDDKSEQKRIKLNVSNSIPEVTAEDKCLTSECLVEDGSEPLKITKTETTLLFTATEGEKGTTSGIGLEKPALSYSETGSSLCDVIYNVPSQEITSQDEKSTSPEPRKSAVGDMEVKKYSITNEAILNENPGGSSAQSMQGASQVENADPKGVSPLKLTINSKSCTASMDLPASNLEVRFEFVGRNGQGCDEAAKAESSYTPCVAPSTAADHTDHSGEHLMNKKADAEDSEESQHKSQECCSCKYQDEVETKRAVEQSPITEAQVLLEVKGCCDIKNNRGIFEASYPDNSSVVHISTANQTILSNNKWVLTTASEKIGSPLRNSTGEHPLQEVESKETDEILSRGPRSREVKELKTPVDAVAVMDGSASSSSVEYPLRKVNPTKQHSGLLAFKEELDTTRSRQAPVLSNVTVSCGIHKPSCLAEDASSKLEQAVVHSDCYSEEAAARTWEHSYAALCSCESGSSALEACASDEKLADTNVVLMNRALVDNGEPASRMLSASGVGVNGDMLLSEAEHSATNAGTSRAPSTAEEERNCPVLSWSPNTAQNHLTSHSDCGSTDATRKESGVKTDGGIFVAVTSENVILPDSKSSSSEQQEVISQKSEFVDSYTQGEAEQVLKPADFINVSAKTRAEGGSGRLLPRIGSRRGKRKSRQDSLTETVLANADISTSAKYFPKTLKKIRQEMGPPLPPLLPPLVSTPPRAVHPVSPVTSSCSQSSLPSPLSELISPLRKTPVPPLMSALSDAPKLKILATLTTPSPSEMLVGERSLSSPLQFCAATPKHALPVPGRLPPSALGSATPAVPQENSVKILDSMYPELSPRAITLNILKGNIQLSRSSSLDGKNVPPPVHQISGFKDITSASTAFVKTGTTLFTEQPSSNVGESGKRMLMSPVMPKSAKRLRLDSELSKSDLGKEEPLARDSDTGTQGLAGETASLSNGDTVLPMTDSELLLPMEEIDSGSRAITIALEKISMSCFDLFPVIHSCIYVGNTSSVPIMRDEEKEVVYEFGIAKKCFAEPALKAVLNKLRHQKTSLNPCYIQSLCRVYVGICRQLGDLEKARLFCYSLLKEDFPQSGKLILFMGNMWSEIFASESVVNKAIHLVTRKRSKGQVLKCLKTVLNWEETRPLDIGMMISSLLMAIQLCPQMEFQASEWHGEDLQENMWEYVFAIDLLCSHQKWGWTHDHIISKELWPIMDKWVKNRKDSGNASSPSDVIVASVLRLIGRLSQIGLKEGFSSAVKNITSVIGAFLRHAKEKDVPWGVQLAAVYALCELGPSSPSEVLEAIRAWEAANSNSLPPAVTSGMAEVISVQKQ